MACLGIMAGGGNLPREIIAACLAQNRPFVVVVFPGHTEVETYEHHPHFLATLGKIGETLKNLKKANVTHLVLAGKFRRPAWSELKLDKLGLKWMAQSARGIFGDDSLLRLVIENLEKENFTVIGAEEILGEKLLATEGSWGKASVPADLEPDIAYGLRVLKALGACDVGQAVVIQQGLVLGVETIEGTDQLMERCSKLRRAGAGGILIKGLKPQQETRADRPTVGLHTVQEAICAGLQGIIVEAHQVIVQQQTAMIGAADDCGFFIEGRNFD